MRVTVFVAAAILFRATIAWAQQGETASPPTVGMGSKTIEACREDTRKYCATASDYIRKECLVKNWDRIASDCQDALGKPFDGARRGGRVGPRSKE